MCCLHNASNVGGTETAKITWTGVICTQRIIICGYLYMHRKILFFGPDNANQSKQCCARLRENRSVLLWCRVQVHGWCTICCGAYSSLSMSLGLVWFGRRKYLIKIIYEERTNMSDTILFANSDRLFGFILRDASPWAFLNSSPSITPHHTTTVSML